MAYESVFNNFDIYLGPHSRGSYPLSVLASPAGETPEPIRVAIPLDNQAFRGSLSQLRRKQIDKADLLALGRRLTGYLIPTGQVRDLYQRSLGLAEGKGLNLRLRLRISAPELETLPWEFAYDDNLADFFVLNPRTALVRYHNEAVPPVSVASYAPTPILVVISNPPGSRPLDVVGETRNLVEALSQLLQEGQALVDVLCTVSPEAQSQIVSLTGDAAGIRLLPSPASIDGLRDALRRGYRVLHYIGHAGFDAFTGGMIALAGEGGAPEFASAQTLARELRGTGIAVVVLNACESAAEDADPAVMGLAPNLIRAGIPAAIAMQYTIADSSAIHFSRTLYRALADGWPLDAAVTEGRKAISAHVSENSIDWGIPVLFMRSPDGIIWQKERAVDEKQAPSTPAPGSRVGGVNFYGPAEVNAPVIGGNSEGDIDLDLKIVRGDEVHGDKIVTRIGSIGAGAQVMAGKQEHVTQVMAQQPAGLTGAERAELDALIAELKATLARADAPEGKKLVGQEFVGQLEGELTKKDGAPDGSIIKVAGEWLLKNIPALAGTLASVFLNPIVGKVVEAAGDLAAGWVKQRFGSAPSS